MEDAEMTKKADHVVTGEILEVTSKVQKPEVEKAKGHHRDRVFTITVKIRKIDKGRGLKVGQEIEVIAWNPHTRIPPLPGPQGHGTIPAKGDSATFYLYAGDGKRFKPLLPNGIMPVEK
jgi:hypothetical protein